MFVREITIKREGDYGFNTVNPSKPMIAKIKVEGQSIETMIVLSEAVSTRVLQIIADEVAAAGRVVAQSMVAGLFEQLALPSVSEAADINPNDIPEGLNDDGKSPF